MNGMIETKLLGRKVTVMGGRYREKPVGIKGVKLAVEIDAPCDVRVDVPDFGVPRYADVDDAVYQALKILCEDGAIYIGCMGGIGRTGMFMAMLIKTIGILNLQREEKTWWYKIKKFLGADPSPNLGMIHYPINFVRDEYLSTAVETDEQCDFVSRYDPTEMLAIRVRIHNCLDVVN